MEDVPDACRLLRRQLLARLLYVSREYATHFPASFDLLRVAAADGCRCLTARGVPLEEMGKLTSHHHLTSTLGR